MSLAAAGPEGQTSLPPPMEYENCNDEEGGHHISQNPHQTIFLWSHEEEWLVDVGQDVDGVGGDRMRSGTPGQSVEPRLADHVEVSADVH